jgi:hypothetical protein
MAFVSRQSLVDQIYLMDVDASGVGANHQLYKHKRPPGLESSPDLYPKGFGYKALKLAGLVSRFGITYLYDWLLSAFIGVHRVPILVPV